MTSHDPAPRPGDADTPASRRIELAALMATALRRWLDGPGRTSPPSTETSHAQSSPLDRVGCSRLTPDATRPSRGVEGDEA